MKKILLTLLLLCGSVFGQVTIDTTHYHVSAISSYNPLGSPRQQLGLLTDSAHLTWWLNGVVYLSYSENSTPLNNTGPSYTVIASNHVHLQTYLDTIYLGRTGHMYSLTDNGASTYLDPVNGDTFTVTTNIQSVCKLPNSDTIISVFGDDATPGYNNVFSVSTDNCDTWSDTSRFASCGTSGTVRTGAMTANNTVYAYIWDAASNSEADSIHAWVFNRSTGSFDSDGTPMTGEFSRGYTFTMIGDTIQFVVACSYPDSANRYLYYSYKNVDSSNWHYDSLSIGSGYTSSSGTMMGCGVTYIESSKRTVVWYEKFYGQADDSVMTYCQVFNWSDSSFSGTEYRISTGYDVYGDGENNGAGHYITPSAWGDQFYIMYEADSADAGTDYNTYITKVSFDSTSGYVYDTIYNADLPFNTPYADTMYIVGETLTSSSGTAITIDENNVTLDFNGFPLLFGSGGGDACTGVQINADSVIIKNGSVIHNITPTDTVMNISAFQIGNGGGTEVTIRDMYAYVTGYVDTLQSGEGTSVNVLYSGLAGSYGTLYHLNLINDSLENKCTGYYKRYYYPAMTLLIYGGMSNSDVPDPDTDYHVLIDSSYLYTPFVGVRFDGYNPDSCAGVLWARNSTLEGGSRPGNNWSTAQGGFSHGDDYLITLRFASIGKIYNNTFKSDTTIFSAGDTAFGCKGIFLVGAWPTTYGGYTNEFTEIYNNTFDVYSGKQHRTDYSLDHTTDITPRYAEFVKIYNNTATLLADTTNDRWYSSPEANFVWAGYNNNDATLKDSIIIKNNTVDIAVGDGCLGKLFKGRGKGASDLWYTLGNNVTASGDGFVPYDLVADDYIANVEFIADTFDFVGTYMWNFGLLSNAWSSYDISGIDLVYPDSLASDTAIDFNTGGTKEVFLKSTFTITVTDSVSNPVENAFVVITNNYGQTVLDTTTNTSGVAVDTITYWYESNTATDSTAFQPFEIKVISPDELDTMVVSSFNAVNIPGGRDTTLSFSAYAESPSTISKKLGKIYLRKGKL